MSTITLKTTSKKKLDLIEALAKELGITVSENNYTLDVSIRICPSIQKRFETCKKAWLKDGITG